MQTIRPPAIAGTFYPGSAAALERELNTLFAEARPAFPDQPAPKAIIAPHAGYMYSGVVAAQAYALLRTARATIRRVILLGPVHRVPVRGLAIPGAAVTAFATPLGPVPLDRDALDHLRKLPQIIESDAAHALEHSIEIHLPFLQNVLSDFTLVPLAVGDASGEEVAAVMEQLWGGTETLIVVSSDLSHFLDYAAARAIDSETVGRISSLDASIDHRQACGGTPINGLLIAARRHGLEARLLDLKNSGDTAGSRDRVVGYAAFAFHHDADR